ncbi:alpha/beta hydrolase [Sphingomonas sp. G124]|uniref:Alpha/beta hydrolase n=1 Tax=Sphingomonas cremea TaxID=2904799 RepID=A0A9X1U4Y7_9SPHN|nr:alpha/beta hydrolase [Sphingomonas cremea]MCF2514631.1 alpha/beta hydrolase [Sphingomonas cremea]
MPVASGVTLRVTESGDANSRPPIIFIPGWSAGADIWQGQIDRFDDAYRVIAFDPRSQGDSTKVASGNTPEQRAADLHALLAERKVSRPILVGWSQAVQDIAAYVSLYGTRDIAGIVLVDATISNGAKSIAARPEQAAFQFRLLASYATDQEEYLRGMFEAIISKPQPPGLVDRAIATGMKTPPSIGVAMLVADMFGIDRTPALANIDCPVLIIASSNSEELAEQREEAKQIANARFVEIGDAAHAVFLDQPDRFAAALSEFAASLGTHSLKK